MQNPKKRGQLKLFIIGFILIGSLFIYNFLIQPETGSYGIFPFDNSHLTLYGHARGVTGVSFSPDDSLIASASLDGTIRLWNVSNGCLEHIFTHNAFLFSVDFSPDGSILASSGYYELRSTDGDLERFSTIKVWNVTSGSLLRVFSGQNQSFWRLAFSPDGTVLATGGGNGDGGFIKLWNLTSGKEHQKLSGHVDDAFSIAFLSDGLKLASGSFDGTVKIWDLESSSLIRTFKRSNEPIMAIAYSSANEVLASGGYNGTIQLWNVTSGSLIRDLTGHRFKIWSLAFSPEGSTLASGSGDRYEYPLPMHETTIKLWEVASGIEKASLTGHSSIISSIAFSNDGTKLVSGSRDWTVKLWGDYNPIQDNSDSWPVSSPEEQGLDPTKLDELFDYIDSQDISIHGLVIMRHGVIIAEKYYSDEYHHYVQADKHQLHSVTKSITSALIGNAIKNGIIENVNQEVLDFFPKKNFTNTENRKAEMTIEHLLTMTTGLEWPEWDIGYESPEDLADRMLQCEDSVQFILDKPMEADPGTDFNYNSGASHLLSAIIQQVTGNSTLDFARKHLFEPLGIEAIWETDFQGIARGHSNLFLSPRSMAKIGNLYLNNGTFNEKQVISEEWIIKSTIHNTSLPNPRYGYCWWIEEDLGGYVSAGLDGHFIFVLPKQNIVVAFTECEQAYLLVHSFIIPAVLTS
jgi:WD40 repeat protein